MDLERIGKRLLELRKRQNLTQADLANRIGVTHQSISKWENGQNLPDTEMLIQLSKLYAVSLEYILEGEHPISNREEANQDTPFVKLNGLIYNIIATLLLIPVGWFIVIIKINWMKEVFTLEGFLFFGWLTFLAVFLISIIIHDLIKYIIYKIIGVKEITIRMKDGMLYLYSPEEITVRQAKMVWIIPYLTFIPVLLVSIFFLDIYYCMAFAFILIVGGDDLAMYRYLRKENPNALYIQAKNFLGYRCKDK